MRLPLGDRRGAMLIVVMIGVVVLGILLLRARGAWEYECQRDLEDELLFRARQYVMGIQLFQKKHPGMFPESLDILYKERCLRRKYPDPMTEKGEWDLVLQARGGGAKKLMLAPAALAPKLAGKGVIIGVCSSSPDSGYLEYRGKKKYNEWAVYLGDNPREEMPELEVLTAP